jgi:hypothetical protein
VAQPSKYGDDHMAKVLISVEMRQGLRDLILVDLGPDFVSMRLRIRPCV